MGQAASNLKGSFTFAYIASPTQSYYTKRSPSKMIDENTEKDFLFSHPELYGLMPEFYYSSPSLCPGRNTPSSTYTCSSKKVRERPDSGYMSPVDNESMQIVNDLTYIDRTYYPPTSTSANDVYNDREDAFNDIKVEGTGAHISFTDVMLSSPDKTLRDVYLSLRSIHSLSPNIGMLTMIRKLDLSNNHLTELPESIGFMKNLEVLSVAKNRIKALPDTIGYLTALTDLELSYNEITELTCCISYLNKLKTLSLALNQISRLPTDISGLVSLVSMDLTRNPLRVLPAEVSKLPFLRRMRVDDCPFQDNICYPLKHNAPSLVEICARIIVRQQINIDEQPILPSHMVTYIKSAKSCTSCHGPYYESYVLRGRLMEKTDMHIPLEYTLCSAHWSDADDRILSMFSAQPDTSSHVEHLPYLLPLPSSPHKTVERIQMLSRRSRNACPPPLASGSNSNVTADTNPIEDIPVQQLASTVKVNKKNRLSSSTLTKLTSRLKRSNLTL